MLAGELYRPGDGELQADAAANKAWLARYNAALAAPVAVATTAVRTSQAGRRRRRGFGIVALLGSEWRDARGSACSGL